MKIDIFEPISLCFGVANSLDKIKEYVRSHKNENIFCLGHPIHNEIVSNMLLEMGITILDIKPEDFETSILEIPSNSTVIFSAHGHDLNLDKLCKDRKIKILDTICPIVENVRNQISELANKGAKIIYIGKRNHPESYAIRKNVNLVDFWDISSSLLVDFDMNNPVVYNQTTILKDKLDPIYKALLSSKKDVVIKNTSCSYVNQRYEELKKLNGNLYDYIVIAGSSTSSNTVELYEKSQSLFGKEKALLISKAEDLKVFTQLEYVHHKIALFSGTSAPIQLINLIKEFLTQL